MKNVIVILGVQLLVSAFFAFILNGAVIDYNFFTALGLGNLIIGVIGAFIGLVVANTGQKRDKSFLIASGLLLLLGCLTCTFFPFEMNGHR